MLFEPWLCQADCHSKFSGRRLTVKGGGVWLSLHLPWTLLPNLVNRVPILGSYFRFLFQWRIHRGAQVAPPILDRQPNFLISVYRRLCPNPLQTGAPPLLSKLAPPYQKILDPPLYFMVEPTPFLRIPCCNAPYMILILHTHQQAYIWLRFVNFLAL